MRDIDPVDLIEATRHAPGLSLAMYQSLMEQTAKKKGFISRLFSRPSYAEQVEEMEAYVEDTNSDLSFILSPTYLM